MECPTPCVCGRIVELDEMYALHGGVRVCGECLCLTCDGRGECNLCEGYGSCQQCDEPCRMCQESGKCGECGGTGYVVSKEAK